MDPLSIAASAFAVFATCKKIVSTLYVVVEDVRDLDSKVEGLRDEALNLQRITQALAQLWASNTSAAQACAEREPTMWNTLKASLESCIITIDRLTEKLGGTSGNSDRPERRMSLLKRSAKAVELRLKDKEIDRFRQQIHSHFLAMQIGFQTFQLTLQLQSREPIPTLDHTMRELSNSLSKIEHVPKRTESTDPNEEAESKKGDRNIEEWVRAARTFWSSTSTAIDADRATYCGGSIGDGLSAERQSEIARWASSPREAEETRTLVQRRQSGASSVTGITSARLDSATGQQQLNVHKRRMASRVVKRLFHTAVTAFQRGAYNSTEESLREALEYHNQHDGIIRDRSVVAAVLALVCALQDKWDQVEIELDENAGIEAEDESLRLDLLALLYRRKEDFDAATGYCSESFVLKEAVHGEESLSVLLSASLMASLCMARDKRAEAEEYLTMVTAFGRSEEEARRLHEDILSPTLDSTHQLLERLLRADGSTPSQSAPLRHSSLIASPSSPVSPLGSLREQPYFTSTYSGMNQQFAFDPVMHPPNPNPPIMIQPPAHQTDVMPQATTPPAMRPLAAILPVRSLPVVNQLPFTYTGLEQERPMDPRPFSPPLSVVIGSTTSERSVESKEFSVGSPRRQSEMSSVYSPGSATTEHMIPKELDSPPTYSVLNREPEGMIPVVTPPSTPPMPVPVSRYANIPKRVLKGHKGWVHAVAFSPCGNIVASATEDSATAGSITLWNLTAGVPVCKLTGHEGLVSCVAFSPDGRLLASGSKDKTIRLWDVTNGTLWRTFVGHKGPVSGLAFSPDAQLIASRSTDHTVRLWGVVGGEAHCVLKGNSSSHSNIAFSPDGRLVATPSSSSTIKLWALTGRSDGLELRAWKELKGHKDLSSVAFSRDGKYLASGSKRGSVRIWDLTTDESRRLENKCGFIWSVEFSPDGAFILTASEDHSVRLWDVKAGTMRPPLFGHEAVVKGAVFSPDGSLIASGSCDRTVRLWLTAGQ